MNEKIVDKSLPALDATPHPRILALLSELAVEPWRCVAELIDNSLDNFRSQKVDSGFVSVRYTDPQKLIIEDNGSGMGLESLERAIKAGYSSKSKAGQLGLFGVGFNVAMAKLGRRAIIRSKRVSDQYWARVDVDLNALEKQEAFDIQPHLVEIEGARDSGTIIEIFLNKRIAADFSREKYLDSEIRKNLSRVYSFILRDEIPGLSGKQTGNKRDVQIDIGGKTLKPWLHCIWDEKRFTHYRGAKVHCVSKFDLQLPEVSLCEDCGHWHEKIVTGSCEICSSSKLLVSERSIWGWIGVQRCMDQLNYGLDFIRNGRAILIDDKNIFCYKDPSTGGVVKDYPVEWPADMGRIVGEVHCDHVKVDFIKREFVEDDPSWSGVVSVVSGESSLRPNRTKIPNNSPLAEIFNAFRVNEPGLKYLIPGNGKKAIHIATQNWVKKFRDGDPDYFTDTKWYKATESHDKLGNDGSYIEHENVSTESSKPVISPLPTSTEKQKANVSKESISSPPQRSETINEKLKRLKTAGEKREDLSRSISLRSTQTHLTAECWESHADLKDDAGRAVPSLTIPISANNICIIICKSADALQKYGRSSTDLFLFEVATYIKNLSNAARHLPVSFIFQELLSNFPDEVRSENTLRNRVNEFLERIRVKIHPILIQNSEVDFWQYLEIADHDYIQLSSASKSQLTWEKLKVDANFTPYISFNGIKNLIKGNPMLFFDNILFKQHFPTEHAEVAQNRTLGYICEALEKIHNIVDSTYSLNEYEKSVAELSLDFLNSSLSNDD